MKVGQIVREGVFPERFTCVGAKSREVKVKRRWYMIPRKKGFTTVGFESKGRSW